MNSNPVLPRDCPHHAPHARPEPIPAAGVMFHLLGAVALGTGTLVWAALAVFGAIRPSPLGLAIASVTLTGSVAWVVWLVRVTEGRDEPPARHARCHTEPDQALWPESGAPGAGPAEHPGRRP